MSRFRTTWIFSALVAALAAFTVYEFKNADDTVSAEKGENRVFHLLRDDLEEIIIHTKTTDVVLKRVDGTWRMEKPVADLAEPAAVEGFIYTLLTQKGRNFRSEDDKKPVWSEFGLEPAGSKVTIRGKGKTEAMEVSSKNAFDGSFYIRVKDELWLGDRGLAQLLEREANSFRSRKIYRGPEEINQVEIKLDHAGNREEFTLKRDSAKDLWNLAKPPFTVDSTKAAGWVQKLSTMNGTEFASEMPKGLPSFEVKMADTKMSFSADTGGSVFVTSDKNPTVYKMAATALDAIRVPQIYFRDGKAPFKFNLELVKEIEVHSGTVNGLFVKKDAGWELKNPIAGMELDSDKLIQLIHETQNLEAFEFISVDKGSGIPATAQLSFKGAEGKILHSVSWGSEYKPKSSWNQGQTLRFVRVSGLKEVVGLPKDKLDRLVDSAIIRKKAPENKTAAKAESK